MKKHLYLFAVMLVSLTFILPAQAAEFKFTAIPDEDTARLQQRFDKVAAYLSKKLGIQVTYSTFWIRFVRQNYGLIG
ncbi:MAG: hypothetical protein WAM73_02630 [Desulfobacterales bacterium]